jgi:hypothetical protein
VIATPERLRIGDRSAAEVKRDADLEQEGGRDGSDE